MDSNWARETAIAIRVAVMSGRRGKPDAMPAVDMTWMKATAEAVRAAVLARAKRLEPFVAVMADVVLSRLGMP